MKIYLLLICIAFVKMSSASFKFPPEEFSYAKSYYMNINNPDGKLDANIFNGKDWAPSAQYSGMESSAVAKNTEKLFLYGADALLIGMSKCFTPRHAVVYFNSKDEPIAAISICFQCEKISLWTKKNGIIQATSSGSESKALQQIKTLKNFAAKDGLKIFTDISYYQHLTPQFESDRKLKIVNKELPRNLNNISTQEIMIWMVAAGVSKKEEDREGRVDAEKDESIFILKPNEEGKKQLDFMKLISDNYAVLGKIKVGMTQLEVLQALEITINDDTFDMLRYKNKYGTVLDFQFSRENILESIEYWKMN